jgi:hypothetical protein
MEKSASLRQNIKKNLINILIAKSYFGFYVLFIPGLPALLQEVGKLKAASGRRVNFLPGAKQSLAARFLLQIFSCFFNGKLQINCKPTADCTQGKRIEEKFRGVPESRDIL